MTSDTSTLLLENERHRTLQDALIQLYIRKRPMDGPPAVICTDNPPGFKALVHDKLLHQYKINLKLYHAKKNLTRTLSPKRQSELEGELVHLDPLGGPYHHAHYQ